VPRQLFVFDPPERFVAGTVGQPGDRTFYLQASGGGRLVSVALEKVQVAILAERLEELLEEVRRRGAGDVPTVAPKELEDTAPLDSPVDEEFRVGSMGLAWDGEDEKVVIEALAQQDTEDEDERVVAAGRPPCPLCGLPLDPEGHICPRQNGHRR
jgi:uncharacterized repeat protein (TIGR03847 family)